MWHLKLTINNKKLIKGLIVTWPGARRPVPLPPCWEERSSGCRAPGPSAGAPGGSSGRWLFWFSRACSGTRFLSAPRWAPGRGRAAGVYARWGTGSPRTPASASPTAPRWRPFAVAFPRECSPWVGLRSFFSLFSFADLEKIKLGFLG